MTGYNMTTPRERELEEALKTIKMKLSKQEYIAEQWELMAVALVRRLESIQEGRRRGIRSVMQSEGSILGTLIVSFFGLVMAATATAMLVAGGGM